MQKVARESSSPYFYLFIFFNMLFFYESSQASNLELSELAGSIPWSPALIDRPVILNLTLFTFSLRLLTIQCSFCFPFFFWMASSRTLLERLLNSKHFCNTKSKEIIYANLHGNRQSYIINANMQIKIRTFSFRKFSQDVLHIFPGNVWSGHVRTKL